MNSPVQSAGKTKQQLKRTLKGFNKLRLNIFPSFVLLHLLPLVDHSISGSIGMAFLMRLTV